MARKSVPARKKAGSRRNLKTTAMSWGLGKLHSKGVQLSATLGTLAAGAIVGIEGIEEGDAILVGAAVTTILGVLVKAIVVFLSTRYIRDE